MNTRTLLKLSIAANAIFGIAIAGLSWRLDLPARAIAKVQHAIAGTEPVRVIERSDGQIRPRPESRDDWIALFREEAAAMADCNPEKLYVLLGDSITERFPAELLPPDRDWLNQGISSEHAHGLYERLGLLDGTNPQKIFVMIGINDLMFEHNSRNFLENYRRIASGLRDRHPGAEVVMLSVLPHRGIENFGEALQSVKDPASNAEIRSVNQRLAAIAKEEGATFLDLTPIFSDRDGNLQANITNDGLHLDKDGYTLWRGALMLFDDPL